MPLHSFIKMKGERLYKFEKLCSKTAIEQLFASGNGAMSYPLRVMWRIAPAQPLKSSHTDDTGKNAPLVARFFVSVPKKRLHHAVERVLMRRRIREAFRLYRPTLYPTLQEKGICIEIAFIYIADKTRAYQRVARSMSYILKHIDTALREQK